MRQTLADYAKIKDTNNLYEQDYLQWIEATLQQLRVGGAYRR